MYHWLFDLLFQRRVRGRKSVWDLKPHDRRRVLWSSELLEADERAAQAILGLRRSPRLLIFDEEAAVLVTAQERDELMQAEGHSRGAPPPR